LLSRRHYAAPAVWRQARDANGPDGDGPNFPAPHFGILV
jgi:hypothetical protein